MDDIARNVLSLSPTAAFFVLLLGMSRALGALFGLWGMYYVLGPAAMLRIVLAMIISAPLIVGQANEFIFLIEDTPRYGLMLIPLREFLLGFGLGLLSSLPFFSVLGAAMLIDQYRGDFSPGIQGPESLQIGSYASLNVVMVLFIFVEAGGFMVLISVLYNSFSALPPALPGLTLAPDFSAAIGDIVQSVMIGLIIMALPVMIILFLLEFAINMVARINEQVKMPTIDFLAKSVAITLLMPLLMFGLIRLMQAQLDGAPLPLPLLLRLLGT